MRRSFVVATGFAVGAILAGVGIALAPDAPTPTTTTTTRAADAAGVWWIDPHETPIGPAVLIPESLTVEDGEAVLRYRVVTRAPAGRGLRFEDHDPTGVTPETWTLLTTDGEYPGVTRIAGAETASFAIDDRFLLGSVTGLRIDGYRLRLPYTYLVSLPPTEGASVALAENRTLSVATILAQASSLIVHLDLDQPLDDFGHGDGSEIQVTGVGPEWISSANRQFSGFQIIRDGPEVPDPLVLRIHSVDWVPFPGPIEVDLGGLPRG